MKTNGATWKAYMASWPDGQWFDDSDETFNGVPANDFADEVPDHGQVEFTCGVVYATPQDCEGVALTTHFRRWLKAQTITRLVVEVPNDRVDEFRTLLKSIGGETT